MNTKILIETLTELPDLQLLKELQGVLKTKYVAIPDLNKLFAMFCSIFKCRDREILFRCMVLMKFLTQNLLQTELEICWRNVGGQVIRLCGEENEQYRKKGKELLFYLLGLSNNSVFFLQTLYYQGLQSESTLVMANSIQITQKIFEEHTNLLQHKSNIPIIKLILQKIIRFTFKQQQHANVSHKANDFMHALFYMKFACLDQVLQRMDSAYIKILQKLWEKNKEQLLYKYKAEEQKITTIQYQHLPLINDKIFGVYQPFVMKNLFTPELKSARQYAVQQFSNLFMQHESTLTKFINPITKIIVRLLPDRHIEIVTMLAHILSMQGIANIINLKGLLDVLMPQLGDASVPYRKQVRDCFQKLNCSAKGIIEFYNKKLNEIGENNEEYDWIQVYELFQLILSWISVSQPADCYPPTLNNAILFSFNKRNTKIPKIKDKCLQFLFFLLQKYPSYRSTLEDVLSDKEMEDLEDKLENRRNIAKLNQEHKKEAKETFIQEYNEERSRYLKERKNVQ